MGQSWSMLRTISTGAPWRVAACSPTHTWLTSLPAVSPSLPPPGWTSHSRTFVWGTAQAGSYGYRGHRLMFSLMWFIIGWLWRVTGALTFSELHKCSHFCYKMITPIKYTSGWNGLSLVGLSPLEGVGFFKKFIYFNWMLINLQYCNGFLPYIDMNQPWLYMCSPSWAPLSLPSPSHPSRSSQCTNPEHPVSCIEPGLVICFTYDHMFHIWYIHVSMLFSQIIPPSPSVQFSSVTQSCPTLCTPMNRSMTGLPVHHKLPEFTQTHAHRVGDAIQPSHPLSSPSPPAPNPSQHQGLFQRVNSSHEVAKVLEFQLQYQSFQWTPRTDLL